MTNLLQTRSGKLKLSNDQLIIQVAREWSTEEAYISANIQVQTKR